MLMEIILVKLDWENAEYLPVLIFVAAGDCWPTKLFTTIFLEWSL